MATSIEETMVPYGSGSVPRRATAWSVRSSWAMAGCMFAAVALSPTRLIAADAPTAAADAAFRKLLAEEWERGLQESPMGASYLGDRRFNDRWDDLSIEAMERRHAHARELLKTVRAIEPASLSKAEAINLRLFRHHGEMSVESQRHRWFLVPVTQRDGVQDLSTISDVLPFDRVKDYDDWIARLKAVPGYVDQTIALMRLGMAERRMQPQICMQRVPAQIRKQIVDDPSQSLFYKPFNRFAADFTDADKTRLREQGRQAIRDFVVPSYRKFLAFFEGEYLPACYMNVGAWQAPRGDELYAFVAREHTTTRLTPDEIHEIGLKEVARLRAAMDDVRRQVKFDGDLPKFFEHLRTAPEFRETSGVKLLEQYQAFCKKVDPKLPKLFKPLPRTPYGVDPVPDHMAPDTTAAYYQPPAADGSRPGTFFVNVYKPETRYLWEMPALSLHEAVPGHHLQIALANEAEGLPEFRRFGHFTAYVEGWALYAESLGEEMGFYDDPYARFGQLTYEMWRSVRLVVDTGIHAKRWSRQQAIDFFRDNAPRSELDIVNEVDRYISWPGQALAYKIGQLKILELRRRAKSTLGDKFDLRAFHQAVLAPGPVPLDLLELIVDDWIRDAAALHRS